VVASVRVLRDPGNHAIHLPWVKRVGRLFADDILLWQLVPREPAYVPDFLTPAPTGLVLDLDAELAALQTISAEAVRAQLDLFSGADAALVRELYADPEPGLRRLAHEIAEYWRIALAPVRPRIQLLLDAEIFGRARQLAEEGAAGLLNDLHDKVGWEGETLSIAQRYCTAADVSHGTGLVLVPSVFVWPSVLSVAGDTPQLAYPARGIATLWEPHHGSHGALGAVLGKGRAQLLVEMHAPTSTTDLARRTGMTPGGVSQHLTVLRAAGLVATQRRGKSVLNVRTTLADALLSGAGNHNDLVTIPENAP
jgi:DNA-binding transcriptional ArsR family regulator